MPSPCREPQGRSTTERHIAGIMKWHKPDVGTEKSADFRSKWRFEGLVDPTRLSVSNRVRFKQTARHSTNRQGRLTTCPNGSHAIYRGRKNFFSAKDDVDREHGAHGQLVVGPMRQVSNQRSLY